MQINKYSFLKWYDSSSSGLPEVPYAYWRDRESCGSMPIGIAGELMGFYINVPLGLIESFYPFFPDLKLALVRASDGVVVNSDLPTLSKTHTDPPTNARYNIYGTFTCPNVPAGIYYLKVYRNTGGAEVFRSSYILWRTDIDVVMNTTTFVRFWHDRQFYHVNYQGIPSFSQRFRLGISMVEEQNEGEKEVYFETTTGKPRTFQNQMNKIAKIETYYFDRDMHEAAAVMFDHSNIELNGRRYYPKGLYKRNIDPRSKQVKGEMELYEDEFSSVNRCAS